MPKGNSVLANILLLASVNLVQAAAPLEVRFICHDIIIEPAYLVGVPGYEEDQLLSSSQGHVQTPNHEMAWAPPDIPTTHWGTFFYLDGLSGESFPLNYRVNIPNRDANNNGIFDLLEFTQAIPDLTTSGTWKDPFSSQQGTFTARWNKEANSFMGTVRIAGGFTSGGSFTNPFQIADYVSAFTNATVQGSTISGPIVLPRGGNPENVLGGNFALRVENGVVNIDSNTFTNEVEGVFTWDPAPPLGRDGNEFWAFLNLQDGWPYGPPYDFHEWMVIIKDTNDTDGDGTPDLIDTPTVNPTAPRMEIIKTAEGVRIMVYGDVGRVYTLEQASEMPATQWTNPTAVTVAVSPFAVDLPAPSGPTFWRMRFP
jgi:hypothetical protein